MTLYLFVRYAHFISILILFAMVVAENILVKPILKRKSITLLSKLDGLYGLTSITTVATGLTLWLWIGKPADFYHNWIFYTKVGVITLVGILSIYPTVFFIKQRSKSVDQDTEEIQLPSLVIQLVRIELLLLLIMPLLATLMAAGIGQLVKM